MGGAAVQVLQPTVRSDAHQKIVGRRKVRSRGIAKGRARSQTGYCSDLRESSIASHGLRDIAELPASIMFKKSKSKVLVDEASEEDDVSWHHEHASKDKDSEGAEEVLSPSTKDSKLKKVKSKRDKKLFPPQDDEHILLTGVTVSHRRGSAKKNWEDDKSKTHSEKDKAHCLWDSITMTMKQITPTRKIDKMEGWEPPQLTDGTEEDKTEPEKKKSDSSPLSSPLSLSLPHSLGLPSWVGLGLEEDSSRYASLTESQTGGPAQWAARARDKLAAVRRRSPASLSESTWEGLK